MNYNSGKTQLAFLAASIVTLADMSGSGLRELTELIETGAIQELLAMDTLPYELSYEKMAAEICAYTGWEPSLLTMHLNICVLDRLGEQIASLASTALPTGKTEAERLFSVLCSKEVAELVDGSEKIRFVPPAVPKLELVW